MVQIIELLGNKKVVTILVFFLRHPSMEIYQQDLKKKLKIAKATLIKWLNMLVKYKLLKVTRYGRTKVYSVNRGDVIIKQLKLLDNLLLLSNIRGIALNHSAVAYLYGSAARGEDVEDSDIDILFIGKLMKEDIIREISKISESMQRDINIQIFSLLEWSQIAKKDQAFYERVEKDKVEL